MARASLVESTPAIGLLRSLGLTRYEAQTYLVLLKSGPKDCKALIRLAGVPNGKIYTIVKKLVGRGWILVTYGRPKTFVAIDFETAVKKRLSEMKENLYLLERNALTVSSTLKLANGNPQTTINRLIIDKIGGKRIRNVADT